MSYFPIFLAFALTTLTIITASSALNREHALVHATQLRFMQPAELLARADVQRSIVAQVQANPGVQITTLPLSPTYQSVCGSTTVQNAPCPQYLATATVEGGTAANGSGTGTDACSNANDAAELQETCLSVRITVTLADARGSPLGARSEEVTYRTLDAIPYAVIAGAANIVGGAAEGEANAGGCDPATLTSCSATPPPLPPTDTRMHSYDQCQPGLTLCVDPATGQPYGLRETSNWKTQGYTNQNQLAGAWQP